MADYTDVIASLMGGQLAAGPAHTAWPLPPAIGNLSSFLTPGVQMGGNFTTPGVGMGGPFSTPGISMGGAFETGGISMGSGGVAAAGVLNTVKLQQEADERAKKEGKAEAEGTKGVSNKPAGRTGGPAPADVPAEYRATVEAAAAKYGVDPTLVAAQIKQESGWNPAARNPTSGAAGLGQFMPQTAAAYGVNPADPHSSIEGSFRYMNDLLKQYNGDQTLALVAYNGGPRAVQAWQAGTPFAESREYVTRVTANQQAYRQANAAQSQQAIAQGQSLTGEALAYAAAPVNNGYVFPVQGYRGKIDLHHGSVAGGSDIMAAEGTPVVAMRGGTVTLAGSAGPGGNAVQIQGDDGLMYYYAHLQHAPRVRQGQQVTAGTPLGGVGRTGNAAGTPPHLHIGIGPSIQTGVGPSGGTGGSYNAQALLQQAYGGGP